MNRTILLISLLFFVNLLVSCDVFLPDKGALGQPCTEGGLCLDGLFCDAQQNLCIKESSSDGDIDKNDVETSDKEKFEAENADLESSDKEKFDNDIDILDSENSGIDGDEEKEEAPNLLCNYKSPEECKKLDLPENCGNKDCLDYGWNFECNSSGKCVDQGLDLGKKDGTDSSLYAEKYTGIWGAIVAASTVTSNLPMVGYENRTTFYFNLMKLSQDGGQLLATSKVCKMEMYKFKENEFEEMSESVMGGVVYPETFWKNVAIQNYKMLPLNEIPELKQGSSFTSESFLEVRGCLLDNPATDELPTDENDSRLFDQDNDEMPGMTMKMVGIMTGSIYYVERLKFQFYGAAYDENHISGLLPFEMEQNCLDAEPKNLYYDTKTSYYDKEPERSYFRMKRLSNDATCEDLLKLAEEKNGWFTKTAKLDEIKTP